MQSLRGLQLTLHDALAGVGFTGETWQAVCIAVAVVVLGIAKTGFGGGIGILSITLMAVAMPAREMLADLAILLVVVDLLSNLHYLGQYDWRSLRWLIPGAVVGVGIGCVVLVLLERETTSPAGFDRALSLIIGIICVAVVVAQVIRLIGGKLQSLKPGPVNGLAVGTVAGSVSTISHSAGPIITLYLLQTDVDKRRLVGTMLIYTLLINTVKLVAFAGVGTVTLSTFKHTLWMMPLLPVGTLCGVWLNKRVPEKPFAIIMYIAATFTAVQMIWKAIG